MTDHRERLPSGISRREYLLATSGIATSALAGCLEGSKTSAATITEHTSPDLEKWVDEVPRPSVMQPTATKDGQPYYEVKLHEVEQTIHRDLEPTTVWGYDGQFPGPTIEAEQGEPIYVRWKNKLPDEHLLPVDRTVHSEIIPYDMAGVRAVTHLHGGNIEADSDGKAQAWFTRDYEETGPKFGKKDYYYVNDQPPATLWYHDHSLAITRLNVYAGLAGFYLLRNEQERELGLPAGEYEIPLVLQDRSFNDDGSLFYPTGVSEEQGLGDDDHPDPSIVPQFYGDTSVVNGKAWPRLSVEPRAYRFRLLNGANSRYYNLNLLGYDEETGKMSRDGPNFIQIGNDGGLLSNSVEIEDRIEIGPGHRTDVLVDFADYAGETLLLHNNAPAMYRGESGADEDDIKPLPEIMLVHVEDTGDGEEAGCLPAELAEVPEIRADSMDNHRHLTLTVDTDGYGRQLHLLGTEDQQGGLALTDPVTEDPTVGTTEIWSIANFTSMAHPIHLHLVHFQVLGRQPTNEYDPAKDGIEPNTLEPPAPYELGWNDVVTVHPGDVVHIIIHFGEYEGVFNDQTGEYMWHCHMVEHEDHDMMRPLHVLPDSVDSTDDDIGI